MQRRDFLGANVLVLASGTLAAADKLVAAEPAKADHADPPNHLAAEVQMQFMRPGQLEAAGREFRPRRQVGNVEHDVPVSRAGGHGRTG
jgi:hypothetical protein